MIDVIAALIPCAQLVLTYPFHTLWCSLMGAWEEGRAAHRMWWVEFEYERTLCSERLKALE